MSLKTEIPTPRLKVADAAQHCGVSASLLNKYRVSGDGPPYLKIGAAVVYDRVDLDAWLIGRRRRHTADDGVQSAGRQGDA